ncbi:hypothetical protein IY145_24125 [Methylosinus sp. H3A]|uniref:hypothetical protein n=1 Tax=Methylosinus sp. H3A TaxID=2785786 RepID=UPI0018C1E31B|nr:hypothetical protein [Methylosinus sp. H3A]MBG0812427.1 hypothetical protein [Methylosinus sp. H3A]
MTPDLNRGRFGIVQSLTALKALSDLIGSKTDLPNLALLAIANFVSVQSFTLGAISLPCMLLMTSFVYFYLMPRLSSADGQVTPRYAGGYSLANPTRRQ